MRHEFACSGKRGAQNGRRNVNELFRQYRETGDKAIRNRIAEKYLYIADILAKKFVGRGVEYDDLKQVASLALLKGIDRFDPSLGMQFTSFITPTITGEIKNYFRDKSRLVKLPRRLSEISANVRAFSAEYEGKNGVKPSIREIADSLGISEEEAVRALEVGGTVSLDGAASSGDDEERSLYSLLPDNDDRYEQLEVKDALRSAMKNLSDTEKALIKYRYMESFRRARTAKRLGVSQMFVSRMERSCFPSFREKSEDSV